MNTPVACRQSVMINPPSPRSDTVKDPASTACGSRCPGQILLENFMQPLGLTAYRVAKEIGVAPITLSEIIRGLRAISPAMACRLGAYFNVDAFFWLALQAGHDSKLAAGNGFSDGIRPCSQLNGQKLCPEDIASSTLTWQRYLAGDGRTSRKALGKNRTKKLPATTA